MNGTILTLAAFMVAVGWQGKAPQAIDAVSEDVAGFVPVLAAIMGLSLLSKTRFAPLVNPFITLAVITTVVQRFPTIEKDVKQSYAMLTASSNTGGASGSF